MIRSMWALFKKDLQSEIRTRYAINSLGMFIIVTVSVILFSLGSEKLAQNLTGGLFWVVVFFTAMSGLSRAFVSEEERGTVMTLHLIARPTVILGGKLFFNLGLIFLMNSVTFLLFSGFFETFVFKSPDIFLLVFIFGNIGIAVAATIIAAIIAKASGKATLYPVLSFPILLPLMLIVIDLTKTSLEGTTYTDAGIELSFLACYDIVMLVISYLLFDFIWKD
ncbi:MAG: heme exporter protein CcmB [Ignavibacteria bacterium]|nr:heme exporter protein CcmB [Ignavibacteria bacterium]